MVGDYLPFFSGYPQRVNGDSQHLEERPELQDGLQFELFTRGNLNRALLIGF